MCSCLAYHFFLVNTLSKRLSRLTLSLIHSPEHQWLLSSSVPSLPSAYLSDSNGDSHAKDWLCHGGGWRMDGLRRAKAVRISSLIFGLLWEPVATGQPQASMWLPA